MKRLLMLATTLCALLLAQSSQAVLTLNVNTFGAKTVGKDDDTMPAGIALAYGIPTANIPTAVGELLYKQDRGNPLPADVGPLKDAYSTVYNPTDGTGSTTITFNTSSVDWAKATYIVLKDGNLGSWIWYVGKPQMVSSTDSSIKSPIWNGKETIVIENPWPLDNGGFKAVSHVEFYGVVVPEPSTYFAAALLGLPMVLGWARKSLASRKA